MNIEGLGGGYISTTQTNYIFKVGGIRIELNFQKKTPLFVMLKHPSR